MKFFLTTPLNSRQKTNDFFLAVFFFLLIGLTFFVNPRDVSILSCSFKNMTGHNCPSCGLSRSFYAFANLNITEAFGYHLLGPLLYISIVVIFIKATTEIITDKKIQLALSPAIPKILLIIIAVTWLIFWIINYY